MRVSDWIRGFFRPLNAAKSSFDFGPYSRDIYGCCLGKLQAADIDQEVKERAIGCMGQIVATLGDLLKSNLPGRTNEVLTNLMTQDLMAYLRGNAWSMVILASLI